MKLYLVRKEQLLILAKRGGCLVFCGLHSNVVLFHCSVVSEWPCLMSVSCEIVYVQ